MNLPPSQLPPWQGLRMRLGCDSTYPNEYLYVTFVGSNNCDNVTVLCTLEFSYYDSTTNITVLCTLKYIYVDSTTKIMVLCI